MASLSNMNQSPAEYALDCLREELQANTLGCEERFVGTFGKCFDDAKKLVRLDEKVYPLCDFHARHAIERGGLDVTE